MITAACLCRFALPAPEPALDCDCRPRLELRQEPPGSSAARSLIAALDHDLARVYPREVIFGLHDDDHDSDRMVFLVACARARPLACGALRSVEPAMGEVKRMYVAPELRGRGIARRLLGVIETIAVARRHEVMRLETGNRSPAALHLYRSAGYREIPPYGEYAGNEYSVCFEKNLSRQSVAPE